MFKFTHFFLVLCLSIVLTSCSTRTVYHGWNFDWDDNIMFMPTKIVLFNKVDKSELLMETGAFAVHRKTIGKSGRYKGKKLSQYKIITNDTYNSFKYFRDGTDGTNYFLEHMKVAMAGKNWKGPVWDNFVYALNNETIAQNSTIITARGHSPKAIAAGLEYLQKQGTIKYLIPVYNIFPASHPEIAKRFMGQGNAARPSAIKAKVMLTLLDELQKNKDKLELKKEVISPDGKGTCKCLLWKFSDDDWGNYKKALDLISEGVKANRWPDVKVTLLFTGLHDKKHKPHSVVIKPDGKTRQRRKAEVSEDRL